MNSFLPPDQPTIGPESRLRIEVHAGPLAGKGFPFIGEAITFGRDVDNDISLDDAQVSRHHAILHRQNEQLILEDLDSLNGTWVNGERILGPHILQPTETISMGASVFGVTGFSAPSTVSMGAQLSDGPWRTYQSSTSYPPMSTSGSGNWLLWGGLILLVLLILAIAGVSFFMLGDGMRRPPATNGPVVIISSPVNGSQLEAGRQVSVWATATDIQGVTRLELWVGGQKVTEAISPIATGQSPFTAAMVWGPQVEGSYSVEVRAFNSKGQQSAPTTINLNVTGQVLAGTPSPTAILPTNTPVVSGVPMGVVKTDLNVRTGPGTSYEVAGRLSAGTQVEIVGRSADGLWWQIVYPPSPDQRGWVATEYAPSQNAGNVPVSQPPTPTVTPTPVPTATPTPTEVASDTPTPVPTATPVPAVTATPVPATDTPAPTATATLPPNSAVINFSANPLSLDQGKCTTFSWFVSNVKAVYFDGEGVPGDNNGQPVSRQECPTETTTYTLRVIKQNNDEVNNRITITLNGEKPAAPSNLRIDARLNNGFEFKWDDNSNNETGFKLYNADSNEVLAKFDENDESGKTTKLACNQAYRLYVVAYNDIGESKPSNIVTDQTLDCP